MRPNKCALVITTINKPNSIMRALASGSTRVGWEMIVIGDIKTPADFTIPGSAFYDVRAQIDTSLAFASVCPTSHYARKNIGYLIAMRGGAEIIIETDDDNAPMAAFFDTRQQLVFAPLVSGHGWLNVYQYFSETSIWPRGLPLDMVRKRVPPIEDLAVQRTDCPIQQGLADLNPDVDAIYRLLFPLPVSFSSDRKIALGRDSWCPFNSQNTTWYKNAFPLLYLPSYCSFRMTDIWRSLVAQRIAWENDWAILFDRPSVEQERNEHDLMQDFADEVSGYINNSKIARKLSDLTLNPGADEIASNMEKCYSSLVDLGAVPKEELGLLHSWLDDIQNL
jgi:hypothetical protein